MKEFRNTRRGYNIEKWLNGDMESFVLLHHLENARNGM